MSTPTPDSGWVLFAGVPVLVVQSEAPWTLDLEGLVVPAGPYGLGSLGRSIKLARPDFDWRQVQAWSVGDRAPLVLRSYPGNPGEVHTLILVDLPGVDASPAARGDAESVFEAVSQALDTARGIGVRRLGLPLLGAGDLGLDARESALRSLRALTGRAVSGALDQLTLIAYTRDQFELVGETLMSVEPTSTGPLLGDRLSDTTRGILDRAATMGAAAEGEAVLVAALRGGVNTSSFDTGRGLLLGLAERNAEVPQELRQRIEDYGHGLVGPVPQHDAFSPTLRAADGIRRRFGSDEGIHARHLIAAALLTEIPPSLLSVLRVDAIILRTLFLNSLRKTLPREDHSLWRDVLLLGETSASRVGDALDGTYLPDVGRPGQSIPAENDHLDLATQVGMFASLMTSRSSPLPLSIGLFGEWGSGKSYFMGLLQDRVAKNAATGNPDYHHDIVQITFNAWSYADSNLWASLGDEIFRELAKPEVLTEDRSKALRDDLRDTLERGEELKAARSAAANEAARLQTELAEARTSYTTSFGELARATAQSSGRSALETAYRIIGVSEATERIDLLVEEAKGVGSQAGRLRRAVGRRAAWFAFVASLLAIGLGGLALWADDVRNWLSGGAFVIAAAAVYAVQRLRWALKRITDEASRINRQIERNADVALEDEVLEVRQAQAHVAVVQAQLDEVLTRAGELGRELIDVAPGQRLYTFLNDRAGSNDYRSQLGLISTIRNDLRQLADLMEAWRNNTSDDVRRPIDRIVLYIDDLDRCSPEQVVDVLQAVHLLLAFDLFVVVVGVDPRWLRSSLRREYRRILAEGTDDEDRHWVSTPSDYLEKIFNVPFALPRMSTETYGRLIDGLTAAPVAPLTLTPVWLSDAEPESSSTARVIANPLLVPEPESEVALQQAARPRMPLPPPLPMTEQELTIIRALGPMVRSPRSAKRLLNIYRMLRSTRNLRDASGFLGTSGFPGEYQAVAVLLGLLTGYPQRLEQILWAAPDPDRLGTGGICAARDTPLSWQSFLAQLDPQPGADGWTNILARDFDDRTRTEWAALVRAAGPSAALVVLTDLEPFKFWAPHVARFSFTLSGATSSVNS